MSTADFAPHPIANLFPMIGKAEMEELAGDIRENGLLEPIVLHEAMILDGRNRYAACEKAGIAPRFVEWKGEGGSPLRFVLSHNLHRRHLTTSQRAAIAAEVLPMFEEEAQARMLAGKSDPSLKRGQGTGKATKEAADTMNVGRATVERAKRLRENAPEEFEKVKRGEKTVNAAHRDAGLGDTNRNRKADSDASTPQNAMIKLKSGRDRQRANKAKQRLETGLSQVSGLCQGLQEIDMRWVAAACSAEEAATWAAMAGECARSLKSLRSTLTEASGHA